MDEGNPVDFIAAMAKKYKDNDKVVIGAGTVLDPETARQVILAGANYVVSPGLNVETIKLCDVQAVSDLMAAFLKEFDGEVTRV